MQDYLIKCDLFTVIDVEQDPGMEAVHVLDSLGHRRDFGYRSLPHDVIEADDDVAGPREREFRRAVVAAINALYACPSARSLQAEETEYFDFVANEASELEHLRDVAIDEERDALLTKEGR